MKVTIGDQLSLDLRRRSWGGARTGAGRKRSKHRHDSDHAARPEHSKHHPVHVVLRTRSEVGRLRRGEVFRAINRALRTIASRLAFRVVHLSIQHNHIHALVEAEHKLALSRGMQAFTIAAAKAINRSLGRSGRVFAFRYHATVITSPRQTRNCLAYCLSNWRRHREDLRNERAKRALVDPYSSGPTFTGWRGGAFRVLPPGYEPLGVSAPQTWLLSKGWRRHGELDPRAVPGPMQPDAVTPQWE